MGSLLKVHDLHVNFQTGGGIVQAVRGVSFELQEGEFLAIVGESGSGKSVTAQAIVRLIPTPPGKISQGEILYQGRDLTQVSEREMFKVRGAEIGMIFQDPMTSLNPTMQVGKQISEGLRWHRGLDAAEAKKIAIEMLKLVGIPNPQKRVHQYPHEFSGGMRQRVMIALALASEPKILIADEPTTALDVTIQAQIMKLMKALQQRMQTSIILITHDLGVVAETADRVAVMYGGRLVETGSVEEIFKQPHHPYTWGLLASMPRMDQSKDQELQPIPGSPPDLFEPPSGCPFADRCPLAMQVCLEEMPPMTSISEKHQVACWLEDPEAPKVDQEQLKHLFAHNKC
ncbi:ABC transporter ATP-binding protein [Hazenella coriacea]|uniref:Oligopeptide transport system ATP-binding protein n=1 Tax=Hazenella coriacea TaxID=1179467 RepID=A0A4R3LGL2_9BACL|nr:ABC transporter ATP-binding protein [Hazenella coriacea]TCS96646.1 oligopeptide transport system ATP-binding protein [Hazenella coriacea]